MLNAVSRACFLLVPALLAITATAQRPRFDVASVRENTSPQDGGWSRLFPQVQIVNAPLYSIIAAAHGLELTAFPLYFDFSKVARTLLETRFDITANGNGDQRAMLRTLLEERFQLRTHTEIRQRPLYVLTVARPGRLGPRLRPSTLNCTDIHLRGGTLPEVCTPSGNRLRVRGSGAMADLIARLAQPFVNVPVVDRTDLAGNFEWDVLLDDVRDRADGVSMATAMLEEQLGLRFRQETGPFEVIIVDDLQMPTPN